MSLSRREKTAAVVTAAVVLLWVFDRAMLSPLWSRYAADRDLAAARQQELLQAGQLLRRADRLQEEYDRRLASGLALPPSQAEGRMVEEVQAWAAEAGLANVFVRPDRADPDAGLRVIRCRVTGEGTAGALVRMCWLMENAEIPLRIETLQVASPDSAADRLTIQFQISTLCLEALTAAPSRAAATTQELR